MLFASLLAASSGLDAADCACAFDESCDLGCSDSTCCSCGCYYSQVEALFLARDNRTSRPAVIRVSGEANPNPGTTVLTTGSPDFGMQPGVLALFGWQLDDCNAVELSYFGIYNWTASATATGNNNLALPGDLGLATLDFFAADRMTLTYRSTLNNAELNYVGSLGGDVSLLGGFRYVSVSETFNIRSTDTDTGTSNYDVRASNNLYGGQLGLRWLQARGDWDLMATGKAGIFGNDGQQSQRVTDFPPGFALRDTPNVTGGNVAFVGDLNFSAAYYLDDVWALRFGYNLLWIEGVALAQNQLDFTDTPTSGTTLRTAGFFAHGINAGLQGTW
jgi:hypothetical protein